MPTLCVFKKWHPVSKKSGVCHLEFCTFAVYVALSPMRCYSAYTCTIWLKSDNRLLKYGQKMIFNMGVFHDIECDRMACLPDIEKVEYIFSSFDNYWHVTDRCTDKRMDIFQLGMWQISNLLLNLSDVVAFSLICIGRICRPIFYRIRIWLLTVADWILERSTAVRWQSDTYC